MSEQPTPKHEFGLNDLVVRKSLDRVFIDIPIELVHKVGGKDTITRKIFNEAFRGIAFWSEEFEDTLCVELLDEPEKIELFKQKIIEAAK